MFKIGDSVRVRGEVCIVVGLDRDGSKLLLRDATGRHFWTTTASAHPA